ncbi:Hypothetical predicted protein [Lecanosticta acicola]|uniref:Uncharacterized protein n=1 Tax=Lecanosticta acicola TaxID=111012 RepID=A0AAI8Z0C4_9PEZI|nr:Hypothetical predicted protein [Lecanosticta acicola]
MPSHVSPATWTPVPLPFSRPAASDIPNASEIRACPAEIHSRSGTRIVAFPYYLVKYGTSTNTREGQALLYLEACVHNVPAPRLNAMFQDSDETFIVMDRIPGQTLDEAWEGLSEAEKDGITAELKVVFDEMRHQPCPWTDHFGALDGGPMPYFLFTSHEGDTGITGPFKD